MGSSSSPTFVLLCASLFCLAFFSATTVAFAKQVKDDQPVMSPDIVAPVLSSKKQGFEDLNKLAKIALELRNKLEKVANAPGQESVQKMPEYKDWDEALRSLSEQATKTTKLEAAALDKLGEQKDSVGKLYQPRDALAHAAKGNGNNTVTDKGTFAKKEEAYRSAVEVVDHAAQMAGEAVYKANVAEDQTLRAAGTAFDAMHALAKAKSEKLQVLLAAGSKALKKGKIALAGARSTNASVVEKYGSGEAADRMAAKVRAAEAVVVRGEAAVRETEAAIKLAKLTDQAGKDARTADGELKAKTTKGAALDAAANDAAVVANQDDLVQAALAAKGDGDAGQALMTEKTPAHQKLLDSVKGAEAFRPFVVATVDTARKAERKALLTAAAQLDAEDRAARAVEAAESDFKAGAGGQYKDYLGMTLEKTLEKQSPDSKVDGFDLKDFMANHSAANDPATMSGAVMDRLMELATQDMDSGNLAPLIQKMDKKNSAPIRGYSPEETDAILLAQYARHAAKADELLAKNASDMTRYYQSLVKDNADDELSATVKVNVAQENEEAHQMKLKADDQLLEAARDVIAALRSWSRRPRTQLQATAVLKSAAVATAHNALDKVTAEAEEKGLSDKDMSQKLWRHRVTEAAAQQQLNKAIKALAEETNATNTMKLAIYRGRLHIAEAKLMRLQAIEAIQRHEARLVGADKEDFSLKEPPLLNGSSVASALKAAEYDVQLNREFLEAFREVAELRYQSQLNVAKLAMKKSVMLLSVAKTDSPAEGATGGPDVVSLGAGSFGTGSTGSGPTPMEDPETSNSATGASAGLDDESVQDAEAQLEGDVTRLISLGDEAERKLREAKAATKEGDLASMHIVQEENDKFHKLETGTITKPDSENTLLSAVLPEEGMKAAKDVMEKIFNKKMTTDHVLKTIEQ